MKLTIATPSFNQGRYVEQTICSVLRQLEHGDKFVIVDAGSTDETADIIETYSALISHVHVQPGLGQAGAIRWAFDHFPSDICCYLNTDDILFPGAVARVKQFFRRYERVDLVYGHRTVMDEHNQIVGIWHVPPHVTYLMSRWDYIPQETAFWRRSAMDRAGGVDPSLEFAMDFDLFARMMRIGRTKRLPEFLAAFRAHASSKTSRLNETVGKREVAMIQQALDIRHRPWDRIFGALLRRYVELVSALRLTTHLRETLQRRVQSAIRPLPETPPVRGE